MIKAEASATEPAQSQPGVKSKNSTSQGSGLGMKIGTGPGLVIIVVVSALGIWFKSGDNSNAPETQLVNAQEAAAKAQREAIQLAITQRRVQPGMTAAQAREARGNPSSINRTESAYGAREQWVYGIGEYVYLRNDVVQSVQTSRKQ